MKKSIIMTFAALASLICKISHGTNLPTTEEFQSMLQGCAIGANIEVSADLMGSIATIYQGDKTQGKASIRSQTEFLKLIPEKDRLKAYELYTACMRDLLGRQPQVDSSRSHIASFRTDIRALSDSKKLREFIISNKDSMVELEFYIDNAMMNILPTFSHSIDSEYIIIRNDMNNYLGDCNDKKFFAIAEKYVEAFYSAQKYSHDGNHTMFSQTVDKAAKGFFDATPHEFDMGIDEGEFLCSDVYFIRGDKENYDFYYDQGSFVLKGYFVVTYAVVDENALNFTSSLKAVDQADVLLRR